MADFSKLSHVTVAAWGSSKHRQAIRQGGNQSAVRELALSYPIFLQQHLWYVAVKGAAPSPPTRQSAGSKGVSTFASRRATSSGRARVRRAEWGVFPRELLVNQNKESKESLSASTGGRSRA